jgi:iron complex transport system ATP-binding protein
MALMLALQELSVGYPGKGKRGFVLGPITAEAEPGAFLCVLGRNGAGKSTLMRTIAGLQPPLAGRALLEGEEIAAMRPGQRARRIAVVLTERTFSPGLKVEDVVSLGRQPFTSWHGSLSDEDRRIADAALETAGAAAFRGRFFDDISDGERQRVLIARAIAQTARLMVLDEITAFLDLPGRVEAMSLLRRHAREKRACVLLSSHDLDLSLELADRIWLLDGKGGLAIGSAEELIAAGRIGAAFDTGEVAFSAARRRFELRSSP